MKFKFRYIVNGKFHSEIEIDGNNMTLTYAREIAEEKAFMRKKYGSDVVEVVHVK